MGPAAYKTVRGDGTLGLGVLLDRTILVAVTDARFVFYMLQSSDIWLDKLSWSSLQHAD